MSQSFRLIECGRLTSVLLMRRMVVQLKPRVLVLGGGVSLKPLFFQLFKHRILEAVKFFLLSDERVARVKKISNGHFYYKYRRIQGVSATPIFLALRSGDCDEEYPRPNDPSTEVEDLGTLEGRKAYEFYCRRY